MTAHAGFVRAAVVLAPLLFATACGVDSAETRAALETALDVTPKRAAVRAVWPSVRAFYDARDRRLAWADDDDVDTARAMIADALTHGLDPDDYDAAGLAREWDRMRESSADDAARAEALARFDVRVTTALMTLGHDIAVGRLAPASVDRRWQARRDPPDLAASLQTATDDGDLDRWLESLAPKHPPYQRLRAALAALREQDEPDETRVRRVAANLERWRWMPDDLGARRLVVNIPAFTLEAFENDHRVLEMRVVVGQAGTHETPIFGADLSTVVFSPYWHIPESIAAGETAPAILKDPDYLRRQRIEVLRRSPSGVTPVDPAAIDWENEAEVRELQLRQQPGAGNALGQVKFLFPNRHAVYLHDTPSTALFARKVRAFSHGCVRVAEPEALARFLLAGQTTWSPDRIRAAMRSGMETQVALATPVPVHITYFTVLVDDAGQAVFLPDVYGHDAAQGRLGG